MALAIEHEAKPPLKLSETKDNSMVAASVHIMRINSAALEWFKMFTCTQQLFSRESMAVQQYCYREAPLTSNCELGYILTPPPNFCTGCLSSPESIWNILGLSQQAYC